MDQMEQPPIPVDTPITKESVLLGNGQDQAFEVLHPAAPNVVAALYRTLGGQEVSNPPVHGMGKITYAFATPPEQNEFIAVVIG